MKSQPRHPIFGLLICLTIVYAVAFVGSQATFQGLQGWYQALEKPTWNPPATIFGPVWTVLYALMGVGLWFVWREPASRERSQGLVAFAVQLALNGLWSWLFFAWRRPDLAFANIVLLAGAIVWTMVCFRKVRPLAAGLLLPYLLWVTFATALNLAILRMNP